IFQPAYDEFAVFAALDLAPAAELVRVGAEDTDLERARVTGHVGSRFVAHRHEGVSECASGDRICPFRSDDDEIAGPALSRDDIAKHEPIAKGGRPLSEEEMRRELGEAEQRHRCERESRRPREPGPHHASSPPRRWRIQSSATSAAVAAPIAN